MVGNIRDIKSALHDDADRLTPLERKDVRAYVFQKVTTENELQQLQ